MTNKRYTLLLSLLFFSFPAFSQIYQPEGLNLPGAWNSWTNPPSNVLALGSSTQVTGGEVTRIVTGLGTGRYTTTFSAAASGADVVGGTYEFLFTSGPGGSPYNNKWSGVTVAVNTVQTYLKENPANNSITVSNGKWYTLNWLDSGYGNTSAIFIETSSEPVSISSLTRNHDNPTPDNDVEVTVTLSAEPALGENIYIRYTTDNWSTNTTTLVTLTGTSGSVTIPAQIHGTHVQYYALTTPFLSDSWGTENVDLLSLRTSEKGTYQSSTAPDVTPPTVVSDLDATPLSKSRTITLSWSPVTEPNFDTYEIYYNTTGNPGLTDTKLDKNTSSSLGTISTSEADITLDGWQTTYHFKIRAKDLSGNTSDLSNNAQATTSVLGYDLWLFNGLSPEGGADLSPKGIAGLGEFTASASASGTAGFLYRQFDWTKKWSGAITVNSAGVLSEFNGADGSVPVTNGMYYTFNVPLAPEDGTGNPVAILETSAMPVTITDVEQSTLTPEPDEAVNIVASLSASPSPEEMVYIRYTTDGWANSMASLASVTGTTAIGTIPMQPEGTVVNYYVLTTTVGMESWGGAVDLLTLKANTNNGLNYTYSVGVISNPTSGEVPNVEFTTGTTLTGNLTVSGIITLNAPVSTSGHTLNLASTGQVVGETPSTYIQGVVQTERNLSGSEESNLAGLGVSIDPLGQVLGNTQITRKSGPGYSAGVGINQIWTITPTNQPTSEVSVTLTWPASNDNGKNMGTLVLFKSSDGGATWTAIDASFTTNTNPRSVTFAVTGFSDFTISNGETPLPVELDGFNAQVAGRSVVISWSTRTETNNFGFEVERSTDRINWEMVHFVPGHGTTTDPQRYSVTVNMQQEKVWFRLKQIDMDGSWTYSPLVEVIENPSEILTARAYPNPFNPTTNLEINLPNDGEVFISIFNTLGQLIREINLDNQRAGLLVVTFNADQLASGLYHYRVVSRRQSVTGTFLLVR